MIKKISLLFLFIISMESGFSQQKQLSPLSKISLLTVGTGEDLAAKFGHSAIRFQDPTLGIDEVYGYGTYDFEDPNFYLNFTKGKLSYTISRMPFNYFKRSYEFEQRWVKEQELYLNLEERKKIVLFLENNLLPENRKYKYDFLFDNCATRIPEVFEKTLRDGLKYDYSYLENPYTFRELIHQNLHVNSWSNFGIDLALGAVIDVKASAYEHMFLPLYVYQQMKHTSINGEPFVKGESIVLDIATKKDDTLFVLTPVFWLGIFLFIVIYITYKDFKEKRRTAWLDTVLFMVTGLAGTLILFLWFFTDHDATKMNLNALWAFAPNLIIVFLIGKNKLTKWLKYYVMLLLILLLATIILWVLKIQIFSILITFVLLALGARYTYLAYFLKYYKK
ncbi:DUF4105 domain-containing protein [Maribacter sp. CXY002]|uniref:lipoprotein N-acyltransferase Lnb domain-containing protein n=1 Tax=Maribacter luteocoastalis TaxID=3407671 RepID=UPI003B67D89E